MAERFEHHARLMSALTFVSRITGLIRDGAIARVFGVGPINDAFAFAFLIPNLFRRLFGEGALSSAFIPRYSELERDDPERARRALGLVLVLLAGLLWSLVVVGEIAVILAWSRAPEIAYSYTPPMRIGGVPVMGVSVSYVRLSYELTALMLPYMPLICLVAMGGAALQVHRRFGPTAGSPIILNLCFIIATLAFAPFALGATLEPTTRIRIVAGSVLVSGLLQLAWTMLALRIARPTVVLGDPVAWASVRATLLQAVPMMLGLGVLQLNTLVDGLIASWPTIVGPKIFGIDYPLAEGAMSSIGYAQRLYEFPLGVFGISIATAVFPLLARQNNDLPAFATTVRRALRLTVFVGLPASVGLVLVARESVAALFQGGEFGSDDTARVAWVLMGYAPAIWSYQMCHVLSRAFYARKESMTPVLVSLAIVFLNLTLNITLIFTPLREAGLAWSTALCSVIQAMVLSRILSRRVPGIIDREVVRAWGRTLAISLVMGLAVFGVARFLPVSNQMGSIWIGLSLKVAVALGVYFGVSRWLRVPEYSWFFQRKLPESSARDTVSTR